MTRSQLDRLAAQAWAKRTQYWRPSSEWPWTQDVEEPILPEWFTPAVSVPTLNTEVYNAEVCDEPEGAHTITDTYLRGKYPWIYEKLTRVRSEAQWVALVQLVRGYLAPGQVQNLQIIAPTGVGKSYVIAALVHILVEEMPERYRAPGRMLPIIIEPPKVIPQMYRILAEFRAQAMVTSLASLRASLGAHMITWETVVINGVPTIYPFWNMDSATTLIIVDESQQIKNEDSTQSQIIESAAGHGIPVLPASATPYSRIVQAKIIACILRPEIEFGGVKMRLTPKIWPSWSRELCSPQTTINDWSPASLKRLQQYLEPYTVRWSVPYPHKIITKVIGCHFHSPESKARYKKSFDEWQEVRLQRRKDPLIGVIAELVSLAKHNQVAEEERAEPKVDAALDMWLEREQDTTKKQKFACILGFAHKTALTRALEHFKRRMGEAWVHKNVALIVGGRNCEADKDAFQRDKKPFLLLTIACGGAGLSLDQTRGNKRQRYMFCSAVWNDIQMAQLGGRTQRIMTESASYLYILHFVGTTEQDKLQRVLRKVRCLKEVTTKSRVRTADEGEEGTFVDGVEQIEHHTHAAGDRLVLGPPPESEDEEESAANQIVGTAQVLEFEIVDERQE